MCSLNQDELDSHEQNSIFEKLLTDTFKNGHKLIDSILATHIVTHPLNLSDLTKFRLRLCNKNYDESTIMNRKPLKSEIKTANLAVLAGESKLHLNILEEKIDFTDQDTLEIINTAIEYGKLIYITELLSTQNFNSALHELLASEYGKNSINKHRWELKKKPIDSMVAEAESKWEAGSLLLHNDMAEELLYNSEQTKDSISRNALIKALRPLAKKYGRLRGEKGICKKMTPRIG